MVADLNLQTCGDIACGVEKYYTMGSETSVSQSESSQGAGWKGKGKRKENKARNEQPMCMQFNI